MGIEAIILIILAGFVCELIDASMGMMYGTILSPVLIIIGFDPLLVVPSILISQAIGGFIASVFHQRFKNVDFELKTKNPRIIMRKLAELGYIETFRKETTKDLRVVFCIIVFGVIATVIAALVAVNIPKIVLKTYIGALVIVMGTTLLLRINFRFSWRKITIIGILSAFNKGVSGGGFGPVVTSGQIIAGRNGKSSIGATTLAEAPICFIGFLTYLIARGIPNWQLPIFLSLGAITAAPLGALLTSKFKSEKKLRLGMGILVVILGIWILIKTWII